MYVLLYSYIIDISVALGYLYVRLYIYIIDSGKV